MNIRAARRDDYAQWYLLRVSLWPDATQPEDESDMEEFLSSDNMAVFVAEDKPGHLVGFIEVNIRYYADSCVTRNVGFLEGWYVEHKFRRRGIGTALVAAAEAWARSKGCREMGSNCLLDNDTSLAAHTALGYEEKERLIQFVKPL